MPPVRVVLTAGPPRQRHRARRLALPTALVTAAGAAVLVMAGPAAADTPQTWTTAGTYSVTVPVGAQSLTLDGLGGAGFSGDDAADGVSTGGAGGSGTAVHATVDVVQFLSTSPQPGDVLEVTVGAKGGGGQRGYGDGASGSGGNGGGATTIVDTSRTPPLVLLVAGGGGGGGGGSALFIGYNGGSGGTNTYGDFGVGPLGANTGRGGTLTTCSPPSVGSGDTGESSPAGWSVGGGGGGGGGTCGGQSGGSGDHGAGSGGGGGGGAGGSFAAGTASPFTAGSNSGAGSAGVSFQLPATQAPVITSGGCAYHSAPEAGLVVPVSAAGYPPPTLELVGAPSGFTLGRVVVDGIGTTADLATGPRAPGDYRMLLVATNSAGSTSRPIAVEVIQGGASPTFTSLPSATVQAGSPFSVAVQALACPTITGYHLENAGGMPWLTVDTAGHLTGTPPPGSEGAHVFTIVADESISSLSFSQSFTLTVQPGDLAVTTTGALPPATVGAPYTTALAASGGIAPYAWSLTGGSALPDGLTLHADGTIDGTPTTAGSATPTVQVTDAAGPAATATAQLSLAVSPAPLAVTTVGPLPGGVAGTPYSTTLEATGGTGPYTWSLTTGSTLPDGLTLQPGGTIDGTPTAPGTSTVGVTVTDAQSPARTATASLYLPIQPKPVAAIAVLPPDLPTGQVGRTYTGQLHASGGSGTLQWALAPGAALPPGLVLAASGAITGTPTATGSPSVDFVVTDSGGPATASATYRLTVTPATLAITTTALPAATVGAPYRAPLAAAGGTAPYRWSWAPGSSRPAGLTLHPDGVLDGTPTAAGTASLRLVVADAGSPAQTATASVSVSVSPRPRVPDLSVSLSHLGSVRAGLLSGFAAQVTNTGTGPTSAPATLSIRLAAGLRPTAAAGPGWTCRIAGATVTCTHTAALPVGAHSGVAVLALVTAPAGSTLASTATVGPVDGTPANNSATDTVRVASRSPGR